MTLRSVALLLVCACLACARQLGHPVVASETVKARLHGDAPEAFDAFIAAYERLLRIGERLRVANAERCGEDVGSDVGWIAWSERDFPGGDLRALAKQYLHLGEQPVVVAVATDGPAARAGVRVGDRVRKVGDRSVATSAQVRRAELALPEKGARVTVEREGTVLELPVEPLRACSPAIQPSEMQVIQSGVNRNTGDIIVTLRLEELATDDQVAYALAYPLATVLLGFEPTSNYAPKPYPEPETTQLAVALTERAGYSTDAVQSFLELQAVEQPWMVMNADDPGRIPRQLVALRMVRASGPSQ